MSKTDKQGYWFMILVTLLIANTSTANGHPVGVDQNIIQISPLEHIAGHNLTAVEVEIAPGKSAPSHIHAGFVFVYVLEGTVRSQLNNSETLEFTKGQTWIEPPGTIHSLTQNPSATDKAKLLAVFIAKKGAKLTEFIGEH